MLGGDVRIEIRVISGRKNPINFPDGAGDSFLVIHWQKFNRKASGMSLITDKTNLFILLILD